MPYDTIFKLDKVSIMNVQSINPNLCKRWELADRSYFEFGKVWELADDIKRNGQINPVLVRPIKDNSYQYEVIAGARRWRACLEHNLPLLAVVSTLTDHEAAIAQIKENQKLAICDYSKGIYYSKLMNNKKMTQGELIKHILISKDKLKNFLAFAKIDSRIWDAVGNTSKVSSRTAREILTISGKGENYIKALIELGEEIKNGLGAASLKKAVDTIILGEEVPINDEKTLTLPSGIVVATWKNGNLKFSNNIDFNQKDFEQHLLQFFAKDNS